MIKFRYLAVAYLENNNKTLMMKRNGHSKIATNLWAAIGGHIEQDEHSSPEKACYREIFEETGIERHEILDLKLTYIIMRIKHNEIRVQYVFRGKTNKVDLIECEEGSLHWIDNDTLNTLDTTFTTKETFEAFSRNEESDLIKVGVVEVKNNVPCMNWSTIEDWDNPNFI